MDYTKTTLVDVNKQFHKRVQDGDFHKHMSENVLFFPLCEPREIPRVRMSLSQTQRSPELLMTANQRHDQNPRHSLLMVFTNTDDTDFISLPGNHTYQNPRYLLAFCDCIYINIVTYFEHLLIRVFALRSLFLFSVSA